MPRWLQIAISLVLYAAVMLVLRAVLHAWIPDLDAALVSRLGSGGAWGVLIVLLAVCAAVGFWPRTPDGRLRPLLPPRR